MREFTSSADLLIVIVSFNTKEELAQCLGSVYENTQYVTFEVVVVDNHSTDGSSEMVAQRFPEAKLIANDSNLGFAKANNQALEGNTCRYAVILNSDTIVMDSALDTMVEFMDAHPKAGAVGCRLLNPDGTLQPSCNKRFSLFYVLSDWVFEHLGVYELLHINKYYVKGWDYDAVQEVDLLSGACIMVRREVLETVGWLDERFVNSLEDHDWCLRIRNAGWKIFYLPSAAIVHFWGQSFRQLDPLEADRFAFLVSNLNRGYFIRKHYGTAAGLLFNGMSTVKMCMGLLKWMVIYLTSLGRREEVGLRIKMRLKGLARMWRQRLRNGQSVQPF